MRPAVFFGRGNKTKTSRNKNTIRPRRPFSKRLGIERLENRDLLAIVWANEGPLNDQDRFNLWYEANADVARAIVRRAIDDWNKVITNFNFPGGGNTFNLKVAAEELLNIEIGSGLSADGDDDGVVDNLDYDLYRAHLDISLDVASVAGA